MICKDCRSRVPDKDTYCVSCGRSLRSRWVNWLIPPLVMGSLIAASLAAFFQFSSTGSDIDSRSYLDLDNISLAAAIILAVAALFLTVRRHSLLRNLVLAIIAASAFWFFRGYLFGGGMVGLAALVVLAAVLVLIFRRR